MKQKSQILEETEKNQAKETKHRLRVLYLHAVITIPNCKIKSFVVGRTNLRMVIGE